MKTAIEKAAERCRKAHKPFSKKPFVPYLVWCCHHETRIELLTILSVPEPAENRIAYILTEKAKGERVVRLDNFRPLISIPAELAKACAEWDKARAEWAKACAEWAKACAEWDKACAEWDKARAEWDKARAEWDKAYAELAKAYAERAKARAEWDKARAEWAKACAEWEKTPACDRAHRKDVPSHTWNGKSIFKEAP